MKSALCSIVMLCITGYVYSLGLGAACSSETPCDEGFACQNAKCMKKIGSTCDSLNETDTCVQGAECKAHMDGDPMCQCPAKKGPSQDSTQCVPLAAHDEACNGQTHCDEGLTCENNVCKSLIASSCEKHADCVNGISCITKSCTCPSTSSADATKTKCLKNVGSMCETEGGEDICAQGSVCEAQKDNSLKCVCPKNTAMTTDYAHCLKMLNEDCTKDEDCFVPSPRGACTKNKCSCTDEYWMSDDRKKCNSGLRSAACSVLLILATFVMSRLM